MKDWMLEHYTLSYREAKTGGVAFSLHPVIQDQNRAIDYPHRLVYLVKQQEKYLYVGEAKAALKTRFERGFVSYRHFIRGGKARNGYKGYKWIELIDPKKEGPQTLEVWAALFSAQFDESRHLIEAVEGELVWQIRNQRNAWPLYQNEIHFNNCFDDARHIAQEILKRIK